MRFPNGSWEQSSDKLQEQQMLITLETSLCPFTRCSMWTYNVLLNLHILSKRILSVNTCIILKIFRVPEIEIIIKIPQTNSKPLPHSENVQQYHSYRSTTSLYYSKIFVKQVFQNYPHAWGFWWCVGKTQFFNCANNLESIKRITHVKESYKHLCGL